MAMLLLLLMIKLPVPVTPPEIVKTDDPLALLFTNVVLVAFAAIAPLTVKPELVLFSIMLVTLELTEALIKPLPLPVPLFVIVPAIVTPVVETVTPSLMLLLLLMIRLPVPAIPPLTVSLADPLVLLLTREMPPAPTVIRPVTFNDELGAL